MDGKRDCTAPRYPRLYRKRFGFFRETDGRSTYVKVSRRVAQSADEFGYNIVRDPVHVHDFQATILHLMGLDHEQLVFKHHGRRYRLTDVEGSIVREILA